MHAIDVDDRLRACTHPPFGRMHGTLSLWTFYSSAYWSCMLRSKKSGQRSIRALLSTYIVRPTQKMGTYTNRGVDRGAGPGPSIVPKFLLNIWILIKFFYKLTWLAPPNNKKTNSWLRPCMCARQRQTWIEEVTSSSSSFFFFWRNEEVTSKTEISQSTPLLPKLHCPLSGGFRALDRHHH